MVVAVTAFVVVAAVTVVTFAVTAVLTVVMVSAMLVVVVMVLMMTGVLLELFGRRVFNLGDLAHEVKVFAGKRVVEVHIYAFFPYVDHFSLHLLSVARKHREYSSGVHHRFVKLTVYEEGFAGECHL